MDNTCISCGRVIPEGSIICLHCANDNDMQTFRQRIQTNGDRIRAMTNKELSRWIASMERRALFTNSMTREWEWQKWLESEAKT